MQRNIIPMLFIAFLYAVALPQNENRSGPTRAFRIHKHLSTAKRFNKYTTGMVDLKLKQPHCYLQTIPSKETHVNERSKARKYGLLFYFEIFVCRILVSVDLHVGDVSLLRRGRLIDLDEALALRRPGRPAAGDRDAHHDRRHQRHPRERQGEVDALPVLATVEFPSNGVRLKTKPTLIFLRTSGRVRLQLRRG